MVLSLAHLYRGLSNMPLAGAEKIALTNVVIDSRQVKSGSVFVALKGEYRDGHEFIQEALDHGARAIIAEERAEMVSSDLARSPSSMGLARVTAGAREGSGRQVHFVDTRSKGAAGLQPDPSRAPAGAQLAAQTETTDRAGISAADIATIFIVPSSLAALQALARDWRAQFPLCSVIGVTGSIGKSSTKELVASVLRQRYKVLKSEGNLNSETGLPLVVLEMNEMHNRAVLEMGMYALGEIKALCQVAAPRVGVVTNVGPSHLERLGTLENIARAKGELVEALPEDGWAILNGDDPRVQAMQSRTQARKFFYGLDPQNDLWADKIESFGLEGIAFVANHKRERMHLRVPLIGRHSVHTALAATSVGLTEGFGWDEINAGLQDVAAQLRLIAVRGERGTTILDDTYNSSPASALAALNLLQELSGRKIAVLGDMLELGSYEREGHELVGGRAAEIVDELITVGARAEWISTAARKAGLARGHVYSVQDNHGAIAVLREVMREGDVILVKGSRGVRMEEIVAGIGQASGTVS